MKVMILNGPNINLIGNRETNIYGNKSFDEMNNDIRQKAEELKIDVDFKQSNHEGELIDIIQKSDEYDFIIFNPGAFTHYSIAIRDAIAGIKTPVVEVHLSNIYNREEFRSKSITAPVTIGQIAGFGVDSYILALQSVASKQK